MRHANERRCQNVVDDWNATHDVAILVDKWAFGDRMNIWIGPSSRSFGLSENLIICHHQAIRVVGNAMIVSQVPWIGRDALMLALHKCTKMVNLLVDGTKGRSWHSVAIMDIDALEAYEVVSAVNSS